MLLYFQLFTIKNFKYDKEIKLFSIICFRFGDITCVVAIRDIEAGEEIFTNYGKAYWSKDTTYIFFKDYSYHVKIDLNKFS